MYTLPETELIKIKVTTPDETSGTFVIEPLSPGYGVTLGNSLRRILLSSLEGAAISSLKCEGVTHEFSTLKGMREDIIEFILNLKGLRIHLHGKEATTLYLEKKGPGVVRVSDFKKNPEVRIIDADYYLATLDKNGVLKCQVTVEHGRGYLPVEKRSGEKRPLGTILIDSVFTPIRKVHYEVENTRVGGITNFDKLTIDITTDGTLSAADALKTATQILMEHLDLVKEATQGYELKEKTAKKKGGGTKAKKVETKAQVKSTKAKAKTQGKTKTKKVKAGSKK